MPVKSSRRTVQGPVGPCPIAPVVDVIYSKWTAQVLWCLLHDGRLRFGELRGRLPQVTAKMLAQRLRQLERDGFVTRTRHPDDTRTMQLALTSAGAKAIEPAIEAVRQLHESMLAPIGGPRSREARELKATLQLLLDDR